MTYTVSSGTLNPTQQQQGVQFSPTLISNKRIVGMTVAAHHPYIQTPSHTRACALGQNFTHRWLWIVIPASDSMATPKETATEPDLQQRAFCWLQGRKNGVRFNNNNNNNNKKAAQNKEEKYAQLTTTHIFYPFVMETGGTWHKQAIELTQEISRRITMVTEDNRETTYLFQRLSIALQRGNAVSFQNTMVSE